jgi:hypothetical protein
MSKSRWSVFLSLLLVFLSGTALGTLGYRWYSVNAATADRGPGSGSRGPRDPAEVRKHIVAEMTAAIKLTPQQVAKLGDILDNTRARFEEVHHEMNAKGKAIWQDQVDQVNAILTPDQRSLYQQLRDKHEREREAREKRHGIRQDATRK